MAADDYHVIAYQILLYLYDCLKKGNDPNNDDLEGYRQAHNINLRYWSRVIIDLSNNGYIENANIFRLANVEWMGANIKAATTITGDGIAYLVDNSLMQKIKKMGASAIQGMISTLSGELLK